MSKIPNSKMVALDQLPQMHSPQHRPHQLLQRTWQPVSQPPPPQPALLATMRLPLHPAAAFSARSLTPDPSQHPSKIMYIPPRSLTPDPHLSPARKKFTPLPRPLRRRRVKDAKSKPGTTQVHDNPRPKNAAAAIATGETKTFSSNARDLDRLMKEFDDLIINSSTQPVECPALIETAGLSSDETTPNDDDEDNGAQQQAASETLAGTMPVVQAASIAPKWAPAVYIPQRKQSHDWKMLSPEFC
ncbi:hypothetical protein HDU82_008518 [Entophlyctis luteolus]|nr:hypothetical protein HDU82_008518 [Entophlyctis luteolus]